jgi:hypothetical protein
MMRCWIGTVLLAIGALSSACARTECQEPQTAVRDTEVATGVRAFMQSVANDVTREGPAAWRRHFADGPSFFMAANGALAFADGASARVGIDALTKVIVRIELQWGNDLRVDALGSDLAVVAASYHEIRVSSGAERVDETGYFTAVAERRGGRWQFRDAHWSIPAGAQNAR